MDDDLRSLRDESDDIFSAFDDTDEADDVNLDDLFDEGDGGWVERPDTALGATTQEIPSPARQAGEPKAKQKRRRKRSGRFLGMTAFQRMVLAIFLFLDVTVIGFLLLIALERITF